MDLVSTGPESRWRDENLSDGNNKKSHNVSATVLFEGGVFTRAWEVMTVGVSVLAADPGANKLLTAALTCRGNRECDSVS